MSSSELQGIIDKIIDVGVPFLLNLVAAIFIYIVGKWIAGLVAKTIAKVMDKAKVDSALTGFTKNIIYAGILVFTMIAAVGKLGVQTTSFIAILGAAGLAVGMALQGTLSNFAAGVMLILFRPFKVGDFIEGGGVMGSVKEIQIFNTVLASPDNRKIIVPNSKVAGDTITNFSAIDQRRVDMVFGISYDDDMKKAKQILMKLVQSDPRVLKDPEPLVAVSELGDSSVNLVCRPWVKPADYWGVYFDLTEKGKEALEKQGLSIPYPQQDIHVYPTGSSQQQSSVGAATV
ncbi:MAG: mechanosensitive ion channel [Candidatus Omnitrophica bacterium]|nr:mechanosensitive ion channel [Candidatus Omnitrophota bacterium]